MRLGFGLCVRCTGEGGGRKQDGQADAVPVDQGSELARNWTSGEGCVEELMCAGLVSE